MDNAQIVFARRPDGALDHSCFEQHVSPVDPPHEGFVLCRTLLLSIDAANRAWMQGRTYRERLEPGDVMRGYALGEVVDANGTELRAGDVVWGDLGWQQHCWVPAWEVRPVTVRSELTHHLSVLGLTGVTAHLGLHDVGRPHPGETLLVSAAAGATGSVVGQLGLGSGLRVVGIAGGPDKTAFLVDHLGFDAAVDHRAPDWEARLREACPDGVDVYFDNVGGPLLEAALRRMNDFGRVVCCGAIALYGSDGAVPGPAGVPGLLVTRRLRMEGFIVTDHLDRWDAVEEELAGLLATGRLRAFERVYDGLDQAPAALVDLLEGRNIGKPIVRVASGGTSTNQPVGARG
jgi:NADPH-dependent curcumin reductase CurA